MSRRSRRRDAAKEQFWRKLVDGFDAERSTVRAWCLKHGVSEPSFYAWRRELARRETPAASKAPQLLRMQVAPAPERTPPGVMIELAEGLRLHVAVDQLLEVLEARQC